MIYLSAKERTAESYAKFYLHGANTNGTFDEKGLKEQMLSLKTENARIAQFISEITDLNFKKVQTMMRIGTTMTAQQALGCGIVKEVVHKEVPVGAMIEEIIFVN